MQIEIWSIGKENEHFIDEGVKYYFKKIKPYNAIDLVILPPPKKTAATDPEKTKAQEEELLLKKLQPQHYLILLDERGRQLDSIQWSQQLQHLMNTGTKTIVFLIGGAYGVSAAVKSRANQTWSLSSLVFPHQLVRLVLSEQIYRAFSILNHSPYHHI